MGGKGGNGKTGGDCRKGDAKPVEEGIKGKENQYVGGGTASGASGKVYIKGWEE